MKNSGIVSDRIRFLKIIVFLGLFLGLESAIAQTEPSPPPVVTQAQPVVQSSGPTSAKGVRNFYQVLDEILSDFEYDLKSGQVLGLKDLSIRNIATSENVPPSFQAHLELLISERILKNSKVRIVHCVSCRSKKATMNGDHMVVSSSEKNLSDTQRMAKLNGIQNFMDVAFAYQPSGMILSLQITDADTATLIWSRSYNSESTRAAAQKTGVDYKDLDTAAQTMEYQPTIQSRPVLYFVMAPEAPSGYVSALALGYRMMERYDNRKKEVGFEMNYYMPVSTINHVGANDKGNIYSGVNLTLLFAHTWNLFGEIENYNQPRGGISAGIGGTYASGFLGALIRGSYEWRFAKHWVMPAFLGYRPKGSVIISGTQESVTGMEGGLGVGYLF